MRAFFFLIACGFLFSSLPAQAQAGATGTTPTACTPIYQTVATTTSPATSAVDCRGAPCSTVGMTVLDGDEKAIIACLYNKTGSLVWVQTSAQTTVGSYSQTCMDWNTNGWAAMMDCLQDGRIHLVYANDKNGNAQVIYKDSNGNGSAADMTNLANAIQNGAEISIGTYRDQGWPEINSTQQLGSYDKNMGFCVHANVLYNKNGSVNQVDCFTTMEFSGWLTSPQGPDTNGMAIAVATTEGNKYDGAVALGGASKDKDGNPAWGPTVMIDGPTALQVAKTNFIRYWYVRY